MQRTPVCPVSLFSALRNSLVTGRKILPALLLLCIYQLREPKEAEGSSVQFSFSFLSLKNRKVTIFKVAGKLN